MKTLITILISFSKMLIFLTLPFKSYPQDVENFYQIFPVQNVSNLNPSNQNLLHPFSQLIYYQNYQNNIYDGEYQLWLDKFFWYTDFSTLYGYALSYQYEIVSFPFTMDCGFNGGCGCNCPTMPCPNDDRILTMPGTGVTYNSSNHTWAYPNSGNNTLYGRTPLLQFTSNVMSAPNALVSYYANQYAASNTSNRKILPHTAIKHTINVHCGNSITNNDIIASYSFIYDHTRGKMRFYPFTDDNCDPGLVPGLYDIIFIPELYVNESFTDYNNSNQDIIIPAPGSLNYFPFDEINANGCSANTPMNSNDYFFDPNLTWFPYPYQFNYLFPSPYTLFTAPARSGRGEIIAGYSVTGSLLTLNPLTTNPDSVINILLISLSI